MYCMSADPFYALRDTIYRIAFPLNRVRALGEFREIKDNTAAPPFNQCHPLFIKYIP